MWYDARGKVVRSELDDNGDGIPDWFSSEEPKHFGDVLEDGKTLKLDESWAIHPELIPKESRILNQSDRRVPIRKTLKKP